jgi:hypothetical protein
MSGRILRPVDPHPTREIVATSFHPCKLPIERRGDLPGVDIGPGDDIRSLSGSSGVPALSGHSVYFRDVPLADLRSS